MTSASAELLTAVAQYDASGLWKDDGATSMSSWLAARYGVAWGTGREWVRVAKALTRLPRIAATYAAGGLSWDQLRALTQFATPETDARWAKDARVWTVASLYREAARNRRVREREERDARRIRSLAMWWDDEMRMLFLDGVLPAEQGAAVREALERRAEEIVLADTPDDPGGARLADALVELVAESSNEASAPVMVIHADAQVVAGALPSGTRELAETESGARLSSEAVRRLACDARIEWVLESHGRPVGIGRRGRTIPPQLVRILRHRDAGCRFPGCGRRRWLKAHHLVHWADGGGTDLDNLVLLCHAHHRLIHEGRWTTSGHPGIELRFHDPGGRALRSFLERAPAPALAPG